ncbi:TerB family tellurite resistance protein [Pseudoflavitalea rhizosphaerae]|uniref:TerB family tellurite resistance protein n=1 Tax=Pseudoflavitalea rhizosphaerae TaxID=1884793 RepID=UPI001F4939B2|nr:TerB family tellurite resistance protein [Pseudoflavitalea rhizosphaerae]
MLKLFLLLTICFFSTPKNSFCQAAELQQLILNLEKLNQLRAILDQMYKGYQIVSKGYNTIKDISQGNFSLHNTFLNGLLAISPTVKKYHRIAEIINIQLSIVKQYKNALNDFRKTATLNPQEIQYIEQVFSNLFDRSVENMDELVMVITANKLRMNDAERLEAIDRIYDQMSDKLQFLHSFNKKGYLLVRQRDHSKQEHKNIDQLFLSK